MWRAATSKGDMSQQMVKHGNTFCRVRCLLSKHLASTPMMPPKIPCPPYLLIKTDAIKLVRCKSTIIWLGKNSQIEGMNTRRKLNNPDWRMKQEHYIRAEALQTRESMNSTLPSNTTLILLSTWSSTFPNRGWKVSTQHWTRLLKFESTSQHKP